MNGNGMVVLTIEHLFRTPVPTPFANTTHRAVLRTPSCAQPPPLLLRAAAGCCARHRAGATAGFASPPRA